MDKSQEEDKVLAWREGNKRVLELNDCLLYS